MTSTPADILEWAFVERSLTIPERIDLHRRCPEAFTADPERAEEVLRRWCHVLARPEGASVEDRLGEYGIRSEDLPVLFGSISEDAASEIPIEPWMEVCAAVVAWDGPRDDAGLPAAAFLEPGDTDDDVAAGPVEPMPFQEGLVPWIDVATQRLFERCPAARRLLSESMLKKEQRRLLENLATTARFVLIEELNLRRLGMYDQNDFALGMLTTNPPRTAYIETVDWMVGDGSSEWMRRWSAIARLLGVRVEAWTRAVAEFVHRFEDDRDLVVEELLDGRDPGPLVGLGFGSGDSHNGGRSVAICRFEDGTRIVYKPRSCSVDVAFADIAAELNGRLDPDLQLRVPRTIDRGNWGWVEFIEAAPCADLDGLRAYHRRMGVLLAVIHTLQGNDFHLENVMACGAHPVPIDLETVCVPSADFPSTEFEPDRTLEIIEHSVLRTLLLPSAMGFGGGQARNLGAMRIEVGEAADRRIRRLVRVNTDFQAWVRSEDPAAGRRSESEAWVESGETLDPVEQQAASEAGYREAYEVIRNHRDGLVAESSPVHRLGEAWVRILNRATNIYVRLITQSTEAVHAATGVDRWLNLERAALAVGDEGDDSIRRSVVAVVRAELDAMHEGDVAYFITPGQGLTYWTVDFETTDPVEVEGTRLRRSAVDSALQQLGRMSPEDLARQVELQGDSYRTTVMSLSRALHGTRTDSSRSTAIGFEPSGIPLEEMVPRTLERIAELAIPSGDYVNWIDLSLDTQSESIRPAALGPDLYSGRGGLALLFERAYRALGDDRWLDVARRSLAFEVGLAGMKGGLESLRRMPPGGMMERGGLVAGAWAIGRHEGQGAFRDVARSLAVDLSARTVESDGAFDVIAGSAGYIMLLLRLEEEEPLPGMADVVGRLADHLVRHVRDVEGPGWTSRLAQLPLCGFGHGRAGVALALVQAGRFLDRSDLVDLGLAAFEAEHRLRGATPEDTWPDYRGLTIREKGKASHGMAAWCAGSEGIALSRAAALQLVEAPHLEDDLAFALEGIGPSEADARTHLCCGASGRLLMHRTIARVQGTTGAVDDAGIEGQVAGLLERLESADPGTMGVGLMQGIGGVAYLGLDVLEADGSDVLLLRP